MGTPDQVTGLIVPTDGILEILFQARFQESVIGAGRAAIFIGSNQLKLSSGPGPVVQETSARAGTAATPNLLTTHATGLFVADSSNTYTGDVTTGQIVGTGAAAGLGAPCVVHVAAGSYTVSVQYKSTSGSVTVDGRKLWVSVRDYTA